MASSISITFADNPPKSAEFNPVQRAKIAMTCKRCHKEIPAGRRYLTTHKRNGGICFECVALMLHSVGVDCQPATK